MAKSYYIAFSSNQSNILAWAKIPLILHNDSGLEDSFDAKIKSYKKLEQTSKIYFDVLRSLITSL